MIRTSAVIVGLLVLGLLGFPSVSLAKGKPGGGGGTPTGYDISYPQCGGSFPSNVLFGIVGVNDGIVYSPNPCLGTGGGASELAWAEQYDTAGAGLYANTADPGPALSTHWPTGETNNGVYCDGSDSSGCSYDYGWDAAANSYQDAVSAYAQLGLAPQGATQTPRPNAWWLDVETANSWETNTANDVSDLRGAVDYLTSQGVASIGFYSSSCQWATITSTSGSCTGGTTAFSAYPSWRAGTRREQQTTAQSYCGTTGFTGGPITVSQYPSSGFDADIRC